MKPTKEFFKRIISAICFSPDGKYVAVAMKDNPSVKIYELSENYHLLDTWKEIGELKEQTQTICALDWSNLNKILACSYDRSITVTRFPLQGSKSNQLAYSKNKLSVLCGVWAPSGKKFAIGTSCRKAFIGYFEKDQNLWSTREMALTDQAFQSSVSVVKFHKSSRVVIFGSMDFTIKVMSCFIDQKNEEYKDIDSEDLSYKGAFDKVDSFGVVLLNLTGLQGWVNDIAINGNEEMAIVLQNNNIAIKKIGDGDNNNNFVTARWNGLPLISVVWLNDNSFLASGYENRVGLFTRKGDTFEFTRYLETNLLDTAVAVDTKSKTSAMRDMFEKAGFKGMEKKASELKKGIPHTNVPRMLTYKGKPCSWDLNGHVLFWKDC